MKCKRIERIQNKANYGAKLVTMFMSCDLAILKIQDDSNQLNDRQWSAKLNFPTINRDNDLRIDYSAKANLVFLTTTVPWHTKLLISAKIV